MRKERKKRTVLYAGISAFAALLVIVGIVYALWEKPPETVLPEETPEAEIIQVLPSSTPTPEPMPEGVKFENSRQDGIYTMLLVGLDQMSGSTDTILVGRFDTIKHEVNLVSIPRDTIVNIDMDVRKINSMYIGSLNYGGNGIDALKTQIRWLTGFEPDCYAVLDLNTFIQVIDELGGVDFDVPEEMEYVFDDISHRLYVHLSPGMQHLDGIHAMALCRCRTGYITGDYGRIETQHAFLKACADQFIQLGNIPHARAVANILSENLNTNLSAGNIAWFMRQLLQCRSDDIHLDTLPSEGRILMGYSYAVPELDEWLEMLNTRLNPYDHELGMWDLNMVYCDGTGYAGTQGYLDGDWYYQS